ncbi:MAG: hypothetical protein ACK56U_10520 [Planctomyces sp.]
MRASRIALRRRRALSLLAGAAAAGLTALGGTDAGTEQQSTDDWIWLGNRSFRVGLLRSSGGAIGWISPPGGERSVVNSFDRGRLVQQSWCGDEDGSDWNGRPWRWNPVHWAAGTDIADAVMTQKVALQQELIRIDYRFQYHGTVSHQPRHQELPAVFTGPEYSRLAVCTSDRPWTDAALHFRTPGWPNEYLPMTEHWVALLNGEDWGLGCYVPRASQLTCYRAGQGSAAAGACSYFAPIDTIAVTPGFDMRWTVWLTLGEVTGIRRRFQELQRAESGQ